jgi:glycosyltransferase involved in cell wall biosynthesis
MEQEHLWLQSYDLIHARSPIYSVQEQIEIPLLVPACDIFWSSLFNIPLAPLRAKKRLLSLPDVFHLAFFSSLKRSEQLYARLFYAQAVKRSDHIITISHFSKQEIKKYLQVPDERITVIHLGIEPLGEIETVPLPQSFVLFVGNVKPHKNLKNLSRAIAPLNIPLVVIGKKDGFIHQENSDEIEALFLGRLSDKARAYAYKSASLLAFPSLYEGFGLPPLEAMQSGCPVVASNAASIPEICGNAARYIDPYDLADMRRGIEEVLHQPTIAQELVEKGKARAAQFSWDASIAKHIAVIEQLT